ncbi:MAG: hypothetical protein LBB07_02040 [Bifidobacteriaceae bacterium]|nr:hypothetical protein [Bifidobacteriaceae bacterium]
MIKKFSIFSAAACLVLTLSAGNAYADNQTDNGTSVSSTFTVQPQVSTAGQETSNVTTSNLVQWTLTTLKVPFSPVGSDGKSGPNSNGTGFMQIDGATNNTPNVHGNS